MMDDFTVHDVVVKDLNSFTPTGTLQQLTQIMFYVGAHGPFMVQFAKDAATGQAMQDAINRQVQALRALPGTGTTTP